MATFSYTYTLTNGTTADATQVQQNFTDVRNGISDGTSDISVAACTVAGNFTANGTTNTIGNASSDDFVLTASLASTIAIKTDSTYSIGSTSLRLLKIWSDAYAGVADNSSAGAGEIGEQKIHSGTGLNIGTAYTELRTITLTPGDWDVSGAVCYSGDGPNAYMNICIGTTSASASGCTLGLNLFQRIYLESATCIGSGVIPPFRVSVNSDTPYYLNAQVATTGDSNGANGHIMARRVR